jgi:hypothetical protein
MLEIKSFRELHSHTLYKVSESTAPRILKLEIR